MTTEVQKLTQRLKAVDRQLTKYQQEREKVAAALKKERAKKAQAKYTERLTKFFRVRERTGATKLSQAEREAIQAKYFSAVEEDADNPGWTKPRTRGR